MPLQRVPLLQGAYSARSFIAAAQECLNLYPEKNPQGEESPVTLYLSPGQSRLGLPPEASPVRGLYRATNGQLFAAVGSSIYYIAPNWIATFLGTTAVNTTPVKMGDNGITLVIVDGSAFGWSVDLTSHTYAAISDPNFFGSNFVEVLDTFLIFNKPGTNIFYCSDSNAITFDPLFFAGKVGYPDNLGGISVQGRNIWLIGAQSSSEIWFDAGAPDFPFQIMQGPFIEHGTIATYSIAKQGGATFFLTQDAQGTSIVVEAAGLTAAKISTPAIEAAIGSYGTISDAVGFTLEQLGHPWYWLKFPSANNGLGVDWVYDLSTKQWWKASWLNPATCERESHRAFCTAFAYGVNVTGDRETGQLYMLDPNNPTDAGAFIERRRGYPHMMANGARASYPRFIADIQAGTAGTPGSEAGIPAGLASPLIFPASVTVIDTTFAAPNGTLLQNYALPWGLVDTGSQYTQVDTTINAEVEDGVLTGAGSGSTAYLASGVPTSADYIAQFQAVPDSYGSAAPNGHEVWLIGRADASNNGYQMMATSDGTNYEARLTVMGGGSTTLSMGTIDSGFFEMFLSMQGTSIDVAVQRSEDSMWLNPGGSWVPDFVKAISITDGTYSVAGNVLIGGVW